VSRKPALRLLPTSQPVNTRIGINSPLLRVYAVAFAVDFATMAAMISVPFFVFRQLGGGAAMSGSFGAAQGAFYTIVCLASAGMVQRAKNGLNWAIAGLIGLAVFISLASAFRSPLICGTLFAAGIGSVSLVWPALLSWVGAHPDPHERTRRLSFFNFSWSFGYAIGPLFAGPLCDLDYRLPYVLVLALSVMALLIVRSLPADQHTHYDDMPEEPVSPKAIRYSEAYILAGWTGVIVANALSATARSVFPKRIADLIASGQLRLLNEA
jgi:MFS family permease